MIVNKTKTQSQRVLEIHEQKPNPETWTLKEEELVYRFHYTEVDDASESTLRYCIARYSRYTCIRIQWLVLLLSQFPTDVNYDILEKTYPCGDLRFKKTLKRLISLPTISIPTLQLIARRRANSGRRKKIYHLALKRIKEMVKELK